MTDDEMIIPNHPHLNQSNWQPGDTDDDIRSDAITAKSALRTLERLQALTRVPAEMLVDTIYGGIEQAIKDMGITPRLRIDQLPGFTAAQMVEASLYLQEVARLIGKRMEWKCVECGQDVWQKIDLLKQTATWRRPRRDAHYCSQACRQKAFRKRKRVTANVSDTKAKPSRVTALPSRTEA
jgi:ferredoxin